MNQMKTQTLKRKNMSKNPITVEFNDSMTSAILSDENLKNTLIEKMVISLKKKGFEDNEELRKTIEKWIISYMPFALEDEDFYKMLSEMDN